MSKLVAIVAISDEDDIIDHFDGTPEEFVEKYGGFAFDDCHFFKLNDRFDCDGDVRFYWYRTEERKRNHSYEDYLYIGCQSIVVQMKKSVKTSIPVDAMKNLSVSSKN